MTVSNRSHANAKTLFINLHISAIDHRTQRGSHREMKIYWLCLFFALACSTSNPPQEGVGASAQQADREQARKGIAPQEMPPTQMPAPGVIVLPGTPP